MYTEEGVARLSVTELKSKLSENGLSSGLNDDSVIELRRRLLVALSKSPEFMLLRVKMICEYFCQNEIEIPTDLIRIIVEMSKVAFIFDAYFEGYTKIIELSDNDTKLTIDNYSTYDPKITSDKYLMFGCSSTGIPLISEKLSEVKIRCIKMTGAPRVGILSNPAMLFKEGTHTTARDCNLSVYFMSDGDVYPRMHSEIFVNDDIVSSLHTRNSFISGNLIRILIGGIQQPTISFFINDTKAIEIEVPQSVLEDLKNENKSVMLYPFVFTCARTGNLWEFVN